MSDTTSGAPVRTRPTTATAFFLAAGLLGILLTVAGELTNPYDLDNAIEVSQQAVLALLVTGALLVLGLVRPSAGHVVLVVLAVLTPLTAVAFWLAIGWIAGCAGTLLAWSYGALGRGRPAGALRTERICGLVCSLTAAAWFLLYASSLISEAL